jgi:predicted MFS family arabinose efflux permease
MGSMSFVLQLIVQISSGLVASHLSSEFSLGPFYGNILVSSVFFLHILMQVPAGLLIEQFGARRVLGLGALISCVGGFLFSCSAGFYSALFSRMMMGAGLSCSFVGITAIVGSWFPSYQFTLMVSLAEMLGLFIGGMAEHSVPQILEEYSWRLFFQGVSACCLIVSVMVFLFLRNREQSMHVMTYKDVLNYLKLVSKKGQIWLNGLYSGALFAVVTGFVAGDAAQMMALMPGVSFSEAAQYCAFIMYGVVVGSGAVGMASVRFSYRGVLQLMVVLSILSAACMSGIIWGQVSDAMRLILCGVLGFGSAGYLLSFRVAGDLMSLGQGRSVLMGFTNMLSVLIGPIISVIAGLIQRIRLEDQSLDLLEAHVKLYGFQLTNSLFIATLLLGAILSLVLLRMRSD